MKRIIFFSFIASMIAACGGEVENITWPEDLVGKNALLREKRAAMEELTKDIERLEKEITEISPLTEKKKRLVTTAKLSRKDFKHFVEIQGTVQSDDFVSASSEVGGRILQLSVKEGDNVSKGQVIARLDMEQVDKQIAEIEKGLELAQDVFERQERLWKQNIGSEIQYLQAKNNKERLEKSLETVKFQLSKSRVHAPIAGVVEKVMLKEGELASPGYPIIQILNTSKVKVVAEVPENHLTAVKKGEAVTIKFPALNKEIPARISLIGKTIHPANRTFDVEVDLSNTDGLLKPNLLALMMINDFTEKNAVSVPLELVQQEANGTSYVFVKVDGAEGAIAKKIVVKTGLSYEGEILVTEGLSGDEELIVAGARNITENEPIELQTPEKKG